LKISEVGAEEWVGCHAGRDAAGEQEDVGDCEFLSALWGGGHFAGGNFGGAGFARGGAGLSGDDAWVAGKVAGVWKGGNSGEEGEEEGQKTQEASSHFGGLMVTLKGDV
jgi:hypothetical protein